MAYSAISAARTDFRYYLQDHQGSVVGLSDEGSSGSYARIVYDEYGNAVYTQAGTNTDTDHLGEQPFGYTGRRYDVTTGLYYYRARWYAPELGRFLQTDPIGYEDQMNLYAYVYNDPLNGTDPRGMETAKNWKEAERKAADRLRRQGHQVISTQNRGRRVTATRDGSAFGRQHDIISRYRGTLYLTEIKFSSDKKRKNSILRKIGRQLSKRLTFPILVKKAGTILHQINFDIRQDSDIELQGAEFSGDIVSEMEGDVHIRWEFWSNTKDEKILDTTLIKQITDPDEREEKVNELTEQVQNLSPF